MKYHIDDLPREKDEKIEKSPEDYYPKLVYRPPLEMEMTPELKEKMELTKETKVIDLHEKNKSKRFKSKIKKDNSKLKSAAVEKV